MALSKAVGVKSNYHRGIPLELVGERGAPNYEAALRELQLLDTHYTQSRESLQLRYQGVAGRGNGGWSLRDGERFRHVVRQYPSSLRKRRTLLIDRLTREFPHLTRSDIVRKFLLQIMGIFVCF